MGEHTFILNLKLKTYIIWFLVWSYGLSVIHLTVKQPEPQRVLHEKYLALLLEILKGSNSKLK